MQLRTKIIPGGNLIARRLTKLKNEKQQNQQNHFS